MGGQGAAGAPGYVTALRRHHAESLALFSRLGTLACPQENL